MFMPTARIRHTGNHANSSWPDSSLSYLRVASHQRKVYLVTIIFQAAKSKLKIILSCALFGLYEGHARDIITR